MRIVKFKGGLGNQLFQYAFFKKLELISHDLVKVDLSYYSNIKDDEIRKPRILNFNFNIDIHIATKSDLKEVLLFNNDLKPGTLIYKMIIFMEKTINRKYYFDKNRDYVEIEKILDYYYYDGYWQSYKYLQGIEDILKREITLKRISSQAIKWIDFVRSENSVFIGVRLKDYQDRKNRKIFGAITAEYYLKAMDIIKHYLNNPLFIVFSDDVESAKKILNTKNIIFFDDPNISVEEELIIRAHCKHAIIPNSTYNWWGAWLINNKDKIIIAPKNWFIDGRSIEIVPPDWIKI